MSATRNTPHTGPLEGLKVIEMAALGPVPFCGMMLADMGAEVLRIDRTESVDQPAETDPRYGFLSRGKRSLALDLKAPAAIEVLLEMIASADIVLEGFRPGVMERLGLGPDICARRNPALIYGRMTGWGQTGPLAQAAGHDLNYIALTGVLNAIGPQDGPPTPPLNLLGDFGAGSMYLLTGVLAALHARKQTGRGDVVDAAILDGTVSLATALYGAFGRGSWSLTREANMLDGGMPNYRCYETADGLWVSVAPIERKFLGQLCDILGVSRDTMSDAQAMERAFRDIFRRESRAHWTALLEGTDACYAPVLDLAEASQHPQVMARGLFVTEGEVTMPAPRPLFSRNPMRAGCVIFKNGQDSAEALTDWGISAATSETLLSSGAARQATNREKTS